MVGKGRHSILGTRSVDPVLSVIAPIGLAASAGTGLVVDMLSPVAPGARSLREIADDGPSLAELSPGRGGVAMLQGGDIALSAAIEILERLTTRWPAVTVRVNRQDWPFPIVPVIPIFPGRLLTETESAGVWQPVDGSGSPLGPGPVLPTLSRGVVRRLLGGHLPRRSRWVRAWRPVWDMPWA